MALMPLMNGSCEMRHPADTDGKFPHWRPGPKRDEASRRRLAENR